MIGYLKGQMIAKKGVEVWVDVNGVGYRVRVGEKQGYEIGAELELYIHTVVRQDAIELFGFANMKELEMFEMLLNVSGVGPKTALTIIGSQTSEKVAQAVREADVSFFQHIPGIGKKGAQRIIVDLKGKLPSLKELDLSSEDEEDTVYMALRQFGFKPNDIQVVIKTMDRSLTEQEQVREGLKRLGKR